ncbi:hypothetical protein BJF92_05120 [Rhizobium rhizosphaerae]|uniref:HTH tetR-type domain-containing protein n=1 Tax=Xaviernesmea rhizosphaerae TaxID=1672749 RepID=A0A1Q9AF10_9HYPH|nr:TetR/AcrR family transcriptional regulator [Xaviernesmea rhizosphaerae]OLP53547.1 hypothetical protein BJF92_05120 [Xaviernesmea rhizosphaerae]
MREVKDRPANLREACVEEARAIVAEDGLEKLSLREVARRLGVSHGAPYRHFPSRDHLLAEIVARAFAAFAEALDTRSQKSEPPQDFGAMGRAYLTYALEQPLNYRLMFGTPLPAPADHPEMMRQARHAFALLRENLKAAHAAGHRPVDAEELDRHALFIWATMHGTASLLASDAIRQIDLSDSVLAGAPEHSLTMIGRALALC